MGSSLLLTSSFVVINLLLLPSSHAQQSMHVECLFEGDANYTANSTFEANINTLLTNLSSSTPSSSGFLTSYSGSIPDRVYGLALCRGDTNSSTCSSCLDKASSDLPQNCPWNKNAIAWYDDCLLRYSNTRFAGTADYKRGAFVFTRINISSAYAVQFNNSLWTVLRGLQSYAVSNATGPQLFAAGEMDIGGLGGYEKVYGLVQCSRDITAADCYVCLEQIFKHLPIHCPNAIGATMMFPSCVYAYDVSPFYNWARRLVFPRSSMPPPVPSPPPTSPPPTSSPDRTVPVVSGKRNSTGLLLAITIPSGVVIILLSFGFFYLFRMRNPKTTSDDRLNDDATIESPISNPAAIIRATNNFSDKLGEGGFGAVYKGTLPNGQEIAVKKILRGSLQGVEQLKNEVVLLAKLQHRNLVRLLGVCLEGDEKLLVYEFVANKSLDIILFDSGMKEQLDWGSRYKIINGIARGLLYLHEESQVTIIHRDLKANNILVDKQMNPKISDFGTARLFIGDQTHASTKAVIGTFGYMAPEYLTRGQFSYKSDVFSFGVLVLEIITGRKCNDLYSSENSEFSTDLLDYTWEHWSRGSVTRIVDPSLGKNYEEDEARRCIQMALICVQERPEDRPMMSSVVIMLSSYSVTMNVPKDPLFAGDYSKTGWRRQAPSTTKSDIITELTPR